MKKVKLLVITVLAVASLSSCRMMDFTILSSKNVTINVKKGEQRVSGKGFTVKAAVDYAIEKAGPGYDALIDGVIYMGMFRYKVEGLPIKTSEAKKSLKIGDL